MFQRFPNESSSFYTKLYQIVDDPSFNRIISWGKNNNSFIVWDVEGFRRRILPMFAEFGRDFSKFESELFIHGFRRIGQYEFGHEDFVRGVPELLMKKMSVKSRTEGMEKFEAKLKPRRIIFKPKKAIAKEEVAKVEDLFQQLQI
ncbi:hypothetical protein EUTSA_v10028026mg [Eutrema salsugineum]|uniref:HSF-type DNA-binding domain-containing protein n=1 Tax=Eutrema salsugineum TaxID=72664 RepID=V4LWY8_EUTSA|nr:heat stress transcription factor C-1a [Eutrema salsugineum]ESQ47022.1 hypothetical protein EUTSA_v10028026mg [Eutrema salsugineum]